MRTAIQEDFSIIAVDKFIQATRDSGYKGTPSAVAELVDNSIQAGATTIDINVTRVHGESENIEISVQDNGSGMSPFVLRNALRFGGSTRFNGRSGLGRYGMGLPNSSLSQAKRVTVYTWQDPQYIYSSYLDVEEIASGSMIEVPTPRGTAQHGSAVTSSGTLIRWSKCDRLDYRKISTIASKLCESLGRRFRYYIWDGLKIIVNGDLVQPIDPLFLRQTSKYTGALQFGETIRYEVKTQTQGEPGATGVVSVTFSELPVSEWQRLSNAEKQKMGISKGAGTSIVRAGREVDYGWFFLGGKRRENYDDWWRCEIRFDPILDEAFGITHTKQQIRPKQYLQELLSPDLEAIARTLNARARKAHFLAKVSDRCGEAETIASACEVLLEPLSTRSAAREEYLIVELKKLNILSSVSCNETMEKSRMQYKIAQFPLKNLSFFTSLDYQDKLYMIINPDHPFYKRVYKPLIESDAPESKAVKTQTDLMLLAYARAEATFKEYPHSDILEKFRVKWSNVLATFINA